MLQLWIQGTVKDERFTLHSSCNELVSLAKRYFAFLVWTASDVKLNKKKIRRKKTKKEKAIRFGPSYQQRLNKTENGDIAPDIHVQWHSLNCENIVKSRQKLMKSLQVIRMHVPKKINYFD